MVDGSTLLFYRDPTLGLSTGSLALVEIAFQSSEQTRVLRASVLARAEGQGLWLAIPNTRFARDVNDHGIRPRRGRRLGTDELVRMKRSNGSEYMIRLLDLSIGGARIGGGLPPSLEKGQTVGISIAAADPAKAPEVTRGRVVWVEDGEAGVEFERDMASSRVAAGRLFRSLESPWTQAREIVHLPGCCKDGSQLDPPLPRVRVDGKQATNKAG